MNKKMSKAEKFMKAISLPNFPIPRDVIWEADRESPIKIYESDEILECEMIAHFMQYESDDDGNWLIETNYSSYEIGQDELVYDEQWTSSWDWIMPVVQECKCVKDADYVLIDAIDFSLCNNDLLGVYEAVVKFIKAQKL